MIYMMDFLIDLCLIFAVWQTHRHLAVKTEAFKDLLERRMSDLVRRSSQHHRDMRDDVLVETRITEKLASRAFNLANSATLGVVALQKALAIPRPLTVEQGALNKVAKDEVDELFKVGGTMEWMKPLMTEEELDIYERAQALAESKKAEGMNKPN